MYGVSVLSGSLEISARLKSADDLELLVRVLEANKALFTKADKLEPQILTDADQPATKLSTTQSRDTSVDAGGPTQGKNEGERISA